MFDIVRLYLFDSFGNRVIARPRCDRVGKKDFMELVREGHRNVND